MVHHDEKNEMSEIWREEFLSDLCPHVQPLIARFMDSDCGCNILDFFRQCPLTLLQASDIAYHVRQPPAQVIEALNLLTSARAIECCKVLDFTFYGLTRDSDIQRALEQFWAWRDYWHVRLERVRSGLQLNASYLSSSIATSL